MKHKGTIEVHQTAPAEAMDVEWEVIFTPEQDEKSEGTPSFYARVNLVE